MCGCVPFCRCRVGGTRCGTRVGGIVVGGSRVGGIVVALHQHNFHFLPYFLKKNLKKNEQKCKHTINSQNKIL